MGSFLHLRHRAAPRDYTAFNHSDDMAALRTACGTFSVACVSILFIAFSVQIGIALLKLYTRRAPPSRCVPKPEPAARSVRHLGIIMDGNRRFGKRHCSSGREPDVAALEALCGELCSPAAAVVCDAAPEKAPWLSSQYRRFLRLIEHTAFDGHRSGGEKLLEVLAYCIEARVDMVTAYAFSTDNWQRPTAEVDALMTLFFFFFDRIRKVALDHGIFVRFISTEPERLPPRVLALMERVEEESRRIVPRRLTLNICVSYSGQSEVVTACNRLLARRLSNGGALPPIPVTRAEMAGEMLRSITQDRHEDADRAVFADGVSVEPELIVRTSGEQRISNFLLYECAYSEFAFFDKTWPEFSREDLFSALDDYGSRDKRKGR